MKIESRIAPSPKGDITLYRLTNRTGASVELSTLGAGIISVAVPDRNGNLVDVALGYQNPADYLYDGPCMGKTPGRFAGRIAKGQFSIDGKQYQLPINNGPNSLHGGPEGFQNQVWNAQVEEGDILTTVTFSLFSPDGDMGYPGNMVARVAYSWLETENRLSVELMTMTDRPTIANLTNHAYFNLDGENSGSVLNHTLWLRYPHYLITDADLVPTGEIAAVKGTPMDFTRPKAIGDDIKQNFQALNYGKGYDNCWVSKTPVFDTQKVAELRGAQSGIVLEVETNKPGVVVYTGNWLGGSPLSKSGRPYNDYDGVAIECQNWPDAPNHPEWEDLAYLPEQYSVEEPTYIDFCFSVEGDGK